MDPLDIIAGTADAAFATDEEGRIVIWNRAAERLLGHDVARVLGKPCHDVLCGKDIFGNRYCDENCTLNTMVRRHEAAHRFEMDVRKASGEALRTSVSVVVVPGRRPTQYTLIHLLQPVERGTEVEHFIRRIVAGSPTPGPVSPMEASPSTSWKPPPFTAREIEVLRLLADGTGTQAIADSLFISVATVRNHIQNILRKLDAHSKLEAVSLALRHHLI